MEKEVLERFERMAKGLQGAYNDAAKEELLKHLCQMVLELQHRVDFLTEIVEGKWDHCGNGEWIPNEDQ